MRNWGDLGTVGIREIVNRIFYIKTLIKIFNEVIYS